jgi:hypothetical protein
MKHIDFVQFNALLWLQPMSHKQYCCFFSISANTAISIFRAGKEFFYIGLVVVGEDATI